MNLPKVKPAKLSSREPQPFRPKGYKGRPPSYFKKKLKGFRKDMG